MADQTQRLSTIGTVRMNDNQTTGRYRVRCPRCGYADDELRRGEAHEAAKKGCPDCVAPTDDLAADEDEVGELLTDVTNPLAVSRMDQPDHNAAANNAYVSGD